MQQPKFRQFCDDEDSHEYGMHLVDPYQKTLIRDGTWHTMQFTGLLDKSGKEIYEGDILEEYGKGEGEPFVVKELLPLVRFYENYPSPTKDDWMSWPEQYEIIGNIYENKDLIK